MVGQPWWLMLPVIIALLLWLLPRGTELPGAWARQISTPLMRYMQTHVSGSFVHGHRRGWVFALWLLLSLALAAIAIGHTQIPTLSNLHARVLVVDLSNQDMSGEEKATVLAALGFLQTDKETPTGLVAVTNEAFDIVPITTDYLHLQRYLQVLDSRFMPVAGYSPAAGFEAANAMLQRAKILAPQIVYFTVADLPHNGETAQQLRTTMEKLVAESKAVPDIWLVSAATKQRLGWQNFARKYAAELVDKTGYSRIVRALEAKRRHRLADASSIRERRELTSWLLLVCLPLWMWLYFRRVLG